MAVTALHRQKRIAPALKAPVAYPLPAVVLVFWGWLLAVLASVWVLLAWAWVGQSEPWQWLVAGSVWCVCAAIVWRQPLWPRGTWLAWTGSQLYLRDPAHSLADVASDTNACFQRIHIAMDGQAWMLVRAYVGARKQPVWLLLLQLSRPQRWPDIRRVLYSGAIHGADAPRSPARNP